MALVSTFSLLFNIIIREYFYISYRKVVTKYGQTS